MGEIGFIDDALFLFQFLFTNVPNFPFPPRIFETPLFVSEEKGGGSALVC